MRSGIWATERLSGIENMVSAHVGHAAEFWRDVSRLTCS